MGTRRDFLTSAARNRSLQPGDAHETRLPNPRLVTHEGRSVRFYDDLIHGRNVAINMMYTQCDEGVCPGMTANLRQVQRALAARVGRDLFMYSISLKPAHDRPAVLADYAKLFGVGPGWLFLTGEQVDIELIRRSLGFYDLNPSVDASLSKHTGMLRLGNDSKDRWCMTPALSSPRQIARTWEGMV